LIDIEFCKSLCRIQWKNLLSANLSWESHFHERLFHLISTFLRILTLSSHFKLPSHLGLLLQCHTYTLRHIKIFRHSPFCNILNFSNFLPSPSKVVLRQTEKLQSLGFPLHQFTAWQQHLLEKKTIISTFSHLEKNQLWQPAQEMHLYFYSAIFTKTDWN